MKSVALRLLFSLICALAANATAGSIEKNFLSPPDSARPWVYWFWMDGNASREGITADLEAIQRAGLGGVILMEVDVGVPKGPVKFMSPEWRQLFKHTVAETERLGLQMTVNAGPGWTGSGGPWIKPEQSMQHLVASATDVTGPKHFDQILPLPQRRPAFFGDGHLPPELEKAKNEFYRDVVVLAFPTPSGNYRIADIDEKALYVRKPYSSTPGVKACLPVQADYPGLPPGAAIEPKQILDLTDHLAADGRLTWDAPEGQWTILRFGRTSTGANTRPAPAPGLGLESDKFDPAALDFHFEQFFGTLLRELGPRTRRAVGWTSLHIDSWEMGSQNWSTAFREEFRRRRGYDPLPYLPAMTGRIIDNQEVTERFLWDLRQTAQELVIQNHALHLKELGRRHGLGLSIEPYDMNPCSDLGLGSAADVPMCEFWRDTFTTFFSCREAVSLGHIYGRPIIAAESFTSGDGERWQAHPASLKALGDWAFSAGINRFVVHRCAHQPWLDRWPGMTMGPYGVHWDRTQTWWDMAPAFHAYLARCQFLLRQGLAVADVCFLSPEGAPNVFHPPVSATHGTPPDWLGYAFDACPPEALLTRVTVKNGRLLLPDGMTYRVLVLPETQTMTPPLLRKIKELVQAGATVIGAPPQKSPSLSNYPQCDADVAKEVGEIWGNAFPGSAGHVNETQCGKGRVIWESRNQKNASPTSGEPERYGNFALVTNVLAQMNVPPDFESDLPLRFNHRNDHGADIYFVANPQPTEVTAFATFRVAEKQPEFWFPDSGRMSRAAVWEQAAGRTRIPLRLDPHGSLFVVFREKAGHSPSPEELARRKNWENFQVVQEIKSPWEVRFQPGRGAPEKISLPQLLDLSGHSDDGVKHFSGRAAYQTAFEWNPAQSPAAKRYLDLGDVQVMARVALNGQDLGIVWKKPFRVDASRALRPGTNRLEITVANLWLNRLIGDQSLPPEKRVAWTTWNPFAPNAPLPPSGLLGPVTIQSAHCPNL